MKLTSVIPGVVFVCLVALTSGSALYHERNSELQKGSSDIDTSFNVTSRLQAGTFLRNLNLDGSEQVGTTLNLGLPLAGLILGYSFFARFGGRFGC